MSDDYTVTVDRDACDGVFACLVRDPRFVEDADGLAAIDADDGFRVQQSDGRVTARFDDDRRDDAEAAAAACPLDAITVDTSAGAGASPQGGEVSRPDTEGDA